MRIFQEVRNRKRTNLLKFVLLAVWQDCILNYTIFQRNISLLFLVFFPPSRKTLPIEIVSFFVFLKSNEKIFFFFFFTFVLLVFWVAKLKDDENLGMSEFLDDLEIECMVNCLHFWNDRKIVEILKCDSFQNRELVSE